MDRAYEKLRDRLMIPDAHFQTVLQIWNEHGEKSTCSIEGNCMSPMIREGDALSIKHGNEHIQAGDIIVFPSFGRNRVCRVVRVCTKNGALEYLVKADQEPMIQLISRDRIVGKVTEITGSNGHLRLNSLFWKTINRVLATRSYLAFRRANSPHSRWTRWRNAFYGFFRKLIGPWPVRRMCWGWLLHAYHAWRHIERTAWGRPSDQTRG